MKGWISQGIAMIACLITILLIIVFGVRLYSKWQDRVNHEYLVAQAKPLILQDVADKVKKPLSSLVMVEWYDQNFNLFACGEVAGTSGFGGSGGRQRFYSDGSVTNSEIETKSNKTSFQDSIMIYCQYRE
ncbi:hypothetical protein [Sphingomonas sp. CV7422]|uniref:hypothetical protein n=1 Tax=Sphingomonas sp. CV7422 TaxID=3018036 RepID=UPI0022FDDFEE|nr:hypothetical protein [Sphingomonas sp. CV7422]